MNESLSRILSTALLLALVAGVAPSSAQRSSSDDVSLLDLFELTEATEIQVKSNSGNKERLILPLSFGTETQDVDINSTIHIRRKPSGGREPSPEVKRLLELSENLRLRSAELMKSMTEDSEKLLELDRTGRRDTPEFKEHAKASQATVSSTFAAMNAYLDFLGQSPYKTRQPEVRQRTNDAILTPKDDDRPLKAQAVFASVLDEEIEWMLRELEGSGFEASRHFLALRLDAVHRTETSETHLGLPNYNTIPLGIPVPFEKLNLTPSPTDLANMESLRQDAQAWADLLNNIRAGNTRLREGIEQVLKAQGLDFEKLETAVKNVKEDVERLRTTDWRAVADQLEAEIKRALAETLPNAQRQALERIDPLARTLIDDLKDFQISSLSLLQQVDSVRSRLDGAAANSDPVAALAAVLSLAQATRDLAAQADQVFRELRNRIDQAASDGRELADGLSALTDNLSGLGEALRNRIVEILRPAVEQQLGPVFTDLDALRQAVVEFVEKVRQLELRGIGDVMQIADAGDVDPPDTSFAVALTSAKPTWIEIQTIHPRMENEIVELRAWLYRVERDPNDESLATVETELEEVVQRFRLLRFGWFTMPSVGITYLSTFNKLEGQEDETRTFVPQVSWMFHHRSWRENRNVDGPARYNARWHDHIGVGLHTVVLDLNNDNELEMGFGLTISFFKDFLQLGVGVDLNADEEPYFFIGTRLFEVARNLGVKKP